MSVALVVVEPSRLDELARAIRDEHAAACESALTMLYHGIAAGEALIEAKEAVPFGEWQAWLAQNVEIAHTTVSSYMRVAKHRDYLLAHGDVYTMQGALRALQESRMTTHSRSLAECREIQAYVKRHGPNVAARDFGISYGTAYRYGKGILPETREARKLRRQLQGQARKQQKQDRAVKRALRKRGAATSELYAMAEKMQDVLAAALDETQGKEARSALRRAGEHYRQMRDEIMAGVLGGSR